MYKTLKQFYEPDPKGMSLFISSYEIDTGLIERVNTLQPHETTAKPSLF